MAIKIDLLPGYVKLRKDLRNSITACIVATGAIAGVLLMVLQQRKLDLQTVEANRVVAAGVAAQATAATTAKANTDAKAAPLINAVSFMAAASKTGPQRAALLNLVRQYIYEDAIVSSIDVSDGQKVVIKATVRNPDEYARFLLNLRRASDTQGGTLFKGLPVASGPGGFANGAVPFVRPSGDGSGQAVPIIYPVSVSAEGVLLNPVQIPPDPVGGSATGAPGASGSFPGSGGSGGFPGPPGSMPGASGSVPSPTGPPRT
ncbi:hypothetical protein [Abditibacterium utsteinense]|nr:hypothetical protein [Abditibacterium utsteinense]